MSATAAAIGAGAALSLGGGIFSNKTNKKIARETNALNYKMFQEANQFNREMWDLENEYNLPVNQKQRLLAAGVNPAALVDTPQLGAAASAPSSASPPQMVGYQYQNVLGNVANDMVAFTQALKNSEEAKNVAKQNENFEWKLEAEIDLMKKQGLLSEQSADKIKQEFDLTETNWDSLMKTIQQNAYMTQENAAIANLQHDILMSYGHVKAEAELDKLCAEAFNLIQDGKYKEAAKALVPAEISYKQAMVVIERARQRQEAKESNSRIGVNWATAEGQRIQNRINDKFGEGSAAAKFLIDYYSGKMQEPGVLEAEWKKAYRDLPPGQIGAILREIINDVNPLKGIMGK